MRTRAKRRFRDLNNVFVLDDTWDEHINAAWGEFWQAARWPFRLTQTSVTLAQGTHSIDLDIGVLEFLNDVYDMTQDRALLPTPDIGARPDEIKYREWLFLQHQDSEPIFYQIVGEKIFIFPAPRDIDHTIRISYAQQDPALMVADTDEPDPLPTRYHDALVSAAVAKAHLDDGNVEQAGAYYEEFNRILQQAFKELHPKGVLQLQMDERAAKLAGMASGTLDQQEPRRGVGLN
jgi:hypothetical protein